MKPGKDGALVAADNRQINRLRSQLGFVFQNFNLWPHLSILDNIIEAPRRVLGQSKAEAIEMPRRCWPRSASPTSATASPPSCPAASSSAPPSPAPWPCSRG